MTLKSPSNTAIGEADDCRTQPGYTMQSHSKVLTMQVILHSGHAMPSLTLSRPSNRTLPVVHAHIPHPAEDMHEERTQRNGARVVSRSTNSVRRRQVLTRLIKAKQVCFGVVAFYTDRHFEEGGN